MNLITNASEAYRGQSGVVSLRTGLIYADHRPFITENHLEGELTERNYVFLEISDNGHGIDKNLRLTTDSRMFTGIDHCIVMPE